ncbi:MAG: FliC/FljB family flagellin, partial [Serratia sp. (in: enterobacteria)]
MAQVINTNSLSLMAQNNLNKSQSSLGTAIERLSSGLRINSAKDDAAGQAISNRFTANIKGLTQASRNANDGISLAQTTEGALNEVNDNLQNIRRLTVQSQNGSNSDSDLKSIQDEITQRLSEIDRISQQTDFNGVKVLSKDQSLTIQVGANDGETISIDLKNINKDTLNLTTFDVSDKNNKVGAVVNSVAETKSVTATVGKDASGADIADKTKASVVSYTEAGETKYAIKDTTGTAKYYAATKQDDGSFNYDTAKDVTAAAGTNTAVTDVDVKTGKNVNVKGLSSGDELHSFTDSTGASKYVVKTTGTDGKTMYKDATVAADGTVTATTENKNVINPLKQLDDALSQVDGLRSSLGAVQNRFDSVINN